MTEKTFGEVVEEIKNHLDILDVIQSRVVLKKRGNGYWGCCPFHKEKTPSFCVNTQKQIYKCFGCGEGGDAISFLMKIDNLSFIEVIKDLADKFGIELPESKKNSKEFGDIKNKAKEVLSETSKFFQEYLKTNSEALKAREYLTKRGITDEIIDKYKIGFAPKNLSYLQKHFGNKYTNQIYEIAGLVIKTEDGKYIERFKNRIIIPIIDENDNIIAFGARAIENGQNPKYLNSPDTIFYNKSRTLFGINIAKDGIKEEDYTVIMEGYFDVISAQTAGLKNAVASCGTALTVDHIKLLSKYSKSRKIFLAFDTDAAGLKATERSSDVIKEAFCGLGNLKIFDESYSPVSEDKYSCEIRVVAPFDSKDPDEYIREFGIETYKKYILKAPLLIDFQMDRALKEYNPNMPPVEKSRLVKKIIPLIEEIQNNIVQNEYIKRVSEHLGIRESVLIKEINADILLKRNNDDVSQQIVTKSSNKSEKAQKNLLSMFLTGERSLDIQTISNNIKDVQFTNKNLDILKNAIDKLSCRVNNNVEKLIEALYIHFAEDNELKEIITDLIYLSDSFKGLSEKDFKVAVQENVSMIQQCHVDSEKKELVSKYKNVDDNDVESLEYQMQLRERLRQNLKTGE